MVRTLPAAAVLLMAGSISAQPLLTVAEARVDADGDGLPDRMGEVVTIEATATCNGTLFSGGSGLSFYVQDATAGINVYSSAVPGFSIDTGDSLRITGEITQYNGLTEIKPDSEYDLEYLGSPGEPEPSQMVIHQDVSESLEGLLLALGDRSTQQWVTVASHPSQAGGGYNFEVWNGQAAVSIRVDEGTGIDVSGIEPGVRLYIYGLGGQYDSEPPYETGYQLLPRSQSDLQVYSPSVPGQFHLTVWDNPFSPRAGESMHLEYGGPDDCRFSLTVFDRAGRSVAQLVDSRYGGDVMMWDGRDDNDEWLPVGPYVLLLQAVGPDGGRMTTTETVVIAERLD
ncbi:hypothetical protein GF402_00765 [Candidatus Fermentibacteria bacterium]|nr:hypothetical protein [Candidatus Fermentibacteria bacterium]